MSPEDFATLPPAHQMRILLQILPAVIVKKLDGIELPETSECPQFDWKIYRKQGFHQWASEMDLEGLEFWQRLAQKSVDGGGEYADRDAKKVEGLERWINYRKLEPSAVVTITRGERTVTAAAPRAKPQQYKPIRDEDREPPPSDDDDMSDVPFA